MVCRAKTILTASCGMRGKKSIPLKQIVDQACKEAEKAGHRVSSAPRAAGCMQAARLLGADHAAEGAGPLSAVIENLATACGRVAAWPH